MRKISYFLFACVLYFYVMMAPVLNDNILNKDDFGIHTISSSDRNLKIETNCRTTSVNPRIMTRITLLCRQFFYKVFKKKPILNEEFESVVVVEKFRPQEPRKMTDENTNKCLLLANDCAIIMKGDFVTVQTCV